MRARILARRTPAAVLASAVAAACLLACAGVADAQSPEVGGEVPSVLELSVGRPGAFVASGHAKGHGRHRGRLYTAQIRIAVTATEMPTRLSVADGETIGGARHGHLVEGTRVLSPALEAAAGRGGYRSLASKVDPQLLEWSEVLAEQPASIRLRQVFHRGARRLRRYHKLLLVTVTAGGP